MSPYDHWRGSIDVDHMLPLLVSNAEEGPVHTHQVDTKTPRRFRLRDDVAPTTLEAVAMIHLEHHRGAFDWVPHPGDAAIRVKYGGGPVFTLTSASTISFEVTLIELLASD